MSSLIETINHGSMIVSSTFWSSPAAKAGKLWVSTNAGAIRVLVPPSMRRIIEDMRTGKEVICSRGPWPAEGRNDAMELLFDDDTDSPFALHLGPESVDIFPGEPDADRQWVCSAWDLKKGKPHKAFERPCHWRRVRVLPWLKPW